VTTEDDFQSALDKDPEDWQTRLVFADWLQDRDDLRAEGYRALGELRRWPHGAHGRDGSLWSYHGGRGRYKGGVAPADNALPLLWISALAQYSVSPASWGVPHADSRREAEDRAALALLSIPDRHLVVRAGVLEPEIQKYIDENPCAWVPRALLADLLFDANDLRAEGYRALALLRRHPLYRADTGAAWYGAADPDSGLWTLTDSCTPNTLPADWFFAIDREVRRGPFAPDPDLNPLPRVALEDAVAVAFQRLSADRRNALTRARTYPL
jgi:uncharacterized protein (TIGR02996 family)